MRVLWLASMFPSSFNWLSGPWNIRSLVALRDWEQVEARVICPIGMTPPLHLFRKLPSDFAGFRRWFQERLATPRTTEVEGIPVTYPRWVWPPKDVFWRYEGRVLYRQIRAHARGVIEEFRPDVIHAPWLHPEGVAATLLGKEHGIPVVVQGIGNDANYYLTRYKGRGLVIRDLQQAAVLLFNCESTRRTAAQAGLDHRRVEVIYHGVEVDKFKPADSPPRDGVRRVITVAQLIPRKNHQLLLEAFTKLPDDVREKTELEFVGGGSLRDVLEERARSLGIADKVRFAGRPPHEEMIRRLQQAHLYCLPTLSEGMPVATIEAMACGLPVVASNVDGIPEAVAEGVSGMLVPPADVDALAAALQAALARDWDRQAVRNVVLSKFTWQLYARRMRELYESLLET